MRNFGGARPDRSPAFRVGHMGRQLLDQEVIHWQGRLAGLRFERCGFAALTLLLDVEQVPASHRSGFL
jgi:hypothetical protein